MSNSHDASTGKSPQSMTTAVHGGEPRPRPLDSITTPIVASTTYRFESTAALIAHVEGRQTQSDYSRYSNPTVRAAEQKIAAMSGAADAILVGSGMAAIHLVFTAMLRAGAHVVVTRDIYRPTVELLRGTFAKFGVEFTVADPSIEAIEAAIRPETKLIFTESPTNPHLVVYDFDDLVALKKRHRGVKLAIDATLGGPYNQQPAAHGVDLVIESATKFMGGHNDLLAGVVVGKQGIIDAVRETRAVTGANVDPHAAYLLLRGLKTLPLRMRQHNSSAQRVAEWLQEHPKVGRVWYPGLPDHPSHSIAVRQMRGFGGVVSFELGDSLEDASGMIDRCALIQLGASLGGAESLIHQPVIFSYWDLTAEQRATWGITDNLIRLSVGLEDAEDLIADLEQAIAPLHAPLQAPPHAPPRG